MQAVPVGCSNAVQSASVSQGAQMIWLPLPQKVAPAVVVKQRQALSAPHWALGIFPCVQTSSPAGQVPIADAWHAPATHASPSAQQTVAAPVPHGA